jgi:hypothetical protein
MTYNWPDATTWKLPPTGHDLIGAGRFCSSGKGYSGEFRASIDQTRAKCESENTHSNKGYVGYWWKAWGGGYGGCCTAVDSLATNWPDASTYKLYPTLGKTSFTESEFPEFESMIDIMKMDIANPQPMQLEGLNMFDNMIGLNTPILISQDKCNAKKK